MAWSNKPQFEPPFDVVERVDSILILVELAGMRAEDLNLTLTKNTLLITGTRHRPDMTPQAYYRVEIGFGDFRIEVPLAWSVEAEAVTATYNDGFLRVELPRTPQRQIPVVNHNNEAETDE